MTLFLVRGIGLLRKERMLDLEERGLMKTDQEVVMSKEVRNQRSL